MPRWFLFVVLTPVSSCLSSLCCTQSHFVWVEKSRIQITLVDKQGVSTPVGQFAWNDVVVAERDPGRPIVYELTVDDHAAEIQRSSGVLVCTGTGSTAWMANAAGIHSDQVQAVLKGMFTNLERSVWIEIFVLF
jgi:hypothetical protein